MSDDAVTLEIADGVGTITLNRPNRGNAWNADMANAFQQCLGQAHVDPAIRVVVFTGAGRSFCVGADANRLANVAGGIGGPSPWSRHAVLGLREIDKPTIAAINGGCAAVGLVIALLCDIRFAADSAKITTIFARRGLPAENGASWLLARTVGIGHAADLLLSGRTVLADEAQTIGLINRVYAKNELMASTREYALDIAAHCSSEAMRMIKRQMLVDQTSGFETAVRYGAALLDRANKSDDFREGVKSFVEKRRPRFQPLTVELPYDPQRD